MIERLAKYLASSIESNRLNQILYKPSGSGMPFVFKDDKEQYIKNGYEANPAVYSIVNIISRSASVVPWCVYEVVDDEGMKKYNRVKANNIFKKQILKVKALEEKTDSDLARVLERPNPEQGQSEFIENMLGFLLVTGDTYVHGVEADGVFQELYVMPSHITEIISSGGIESPVSGYKIKSYQYDIPLPYETVMHMKYWNPDYSSVGSHLYGMSPLRAGRSVVQQSNDSFTANQRALQNMGAEGMLTLDDDYVTPEQMGQLEANLRAKATGVDMFKKMVVAVNKWRWIQFGISPVDLNIIESQKMSLRDLCNVYGISSELLNDPDNKTNSNKKESRRALYYETVLPLLDHVRFELNRWLAPKYSKRDGVTYYIDYDITEIPALAEDMDKVADRISKVDELTWNEKREALGYGALDDEIYDKPWVDMRKMPVDLENGQRDADT